MSTPIPTPQAPAPDILRCAYMELVVTDLAASREFYVDVLDLTVTEEDENTVYLRSMEEFIHHNLVLAPGPGCRCRGILVPRAGSRGSRQGGCLLRGARMPRRAPRRRLHEGNR